MTMCNDFVNEKASDFVTFFFLQNTSKLEYSVEKFMYSVQNSHYTIDHLHLLNQYII